MKKLDNKGFILAETLIVSVFIMLIFTMIYNNFYPLIGEYEKREHYDDVDGKYTAYWIKKIVESADYQVNAKDIEMMNKLGYMRFNCSNVSDENHQRIVCIDLVKNLEISGCDSRGDNCDVFITRYQLDKTDDSLGYTLDFKETVRELYWMRRYYEPCILDNYNNFRMPSAIETNAFSTESSCGSRFFQQCCINKGLNSCTKPTIGSNNYSSFYSDTEKTEEKDKIAETCSKTINKKVFNSATKDYILNLPNYTKPHYTTGAAYRIIAVVHHKKDNNDFYSYSNMEVNK